MLSTSPNKTVASGNVPGRGVNPLPIPLQSLVKVRRVPVWAVVEKPGEDDQRLVAMFLNYVAACLFSVDHAARELVNTDVMRVRDDGFLSAEF